MPAPVNPSFNPPANTWQNGKFTVPQGVLDILARQQGTGMGAGAGMASPPANMIRPGAPSSWAQYGLNNPDVMAEWQRLGANQKNPFSNADDYFQWHYANFGQNEGRQGPGLTPNPTIAAIGQQKSSGRGFSPVAGLLGGGLLGLLAQQVAKK